MQIVDGCVASFHYTLTNDAGQTLDSSSGHDPLSYLQGSGNIVRGLEKAMAGKQVGDQFNVDVIPAEGYGEHNPALIQEVPRSAFGTIKQVLPGMQFRADSENGPMSVTVTKVTNKHVTVDGNHALAGQTLHFAIEVTEVRVASEEETSHGHVHGPGGHHH